MEKIKNGVPCDFGFTWLDLAWRVKQDYPLMIRIDPCIVNVDTKVQYFGKYLMKLKLIENDAKDKYEPSISIQIVDSLAENHLLKLFDNDDDMLYEFVKDTTEIIFNVLREIDIMGELYDEMEDSYDNINDEEDIDIFISNAEEKINEIFDILNEEYYDVIKSIMCTAYIVLGYAMHTKAISIRLSNIDKPDKVLVGDRNHHMCVYRSRVGTTYFCPLGI